MFLDSRNIISDHTLCAQSQIMVEIMVIFVVVLLDNSLNGLSLLV